MGRHLNNYHRDVCCSYLVFENTALTYLYQESRQLQHFKGDESLFQTLDTVLFIPQITYLRINFSL